jgi:hypothetical protein
VNVWVLNDESILHPASMGFPSKTEKYHYFILISKPLLLVVVFTKNNDKEVIILQHLNLSAM